jgi:hypothetical protein
MGRSGWPSRIYILFPHGASKKRLGKQFFILCRWRFMLHAMPQSLEARARQIDVNRLSASSHLGLPLTASGHTTASRKVWQILPGTILINLKSWSYWATRILPNGTASAF